MRESGTWMTIWDDRILEYLRENDGATVGELTDSESIRVSNAHVSRRCKKLAEHGMLTPIGNGAYVITERGEAYLREEYDAENETYLNGGDSRDGPSASGTTQP
ncbi:MULTISPECIES: winged helix-turn-helix domain-containing protein [Natrinema]|uniref:Helix-turn-helix transcriptional regulator n=2 Tax=Natrinema TaxID=88723 RepID=A0A4P9TJI9_9EURY|nr:MULTISPECIES: winged helix-turn-helix domain-containing protein [Natrinema]QCW04192.1 helix-turn-helix transcriptional regulator [Natrinema pallidum]